MNGIGQIGHDLPRFGAIAVQGGKLVKRGARIALERRLHEIEDARAIGKAQEAAHGPGLDLAPAKGDGAVEN